MLKVQRELLAKIGTYSKLQMLHLKLASKLAENLVANDIAGYLLNKTNLQKIIEAIILSTDESEMQLIKKIDTMVRRRLNELRPITAELEELLKGYNNGSILTVKSALNITTTYSLTLSAVECNDCNVTLTYSNFEHTMENVRSGKIYNPLAMLTDFVILIAYPFSSKSIRDVNILDDFLGQSYPCTKTYELNIHYEVKKVKQLKPLRLPIIATIIGATLHLLNNVIDRTGNNFGGSNKVLLNILYKLQVIVNCPSYK